MVPLQTLQKTELILCEHRKPVGVLLFTYLFKFPMIISDFPVWLQHKSLSKKKKPLTPAFTEQLGIVPNREGMCTQDLWEGCKKDEVCTSGHFCSINPKVSTE